MLINRDDMKSGAGFKRIFNEDCIKSIDDAYESFAACAVFQACKDYKAWIVASHFTLKELPRLVRNNRVARVLMRLAQSPTAYKHRWHTAEREAVCMKRIKRIVRSKAIVGCDEHIFAIKKAKTYAEVRKRVTFLLRSTISSLTSAKAIISGTTERFANLAGFFDSVNYKLFVKGVDGKLIKAEIERQAKEKIKRKEMGLPDEEDDEDEE